MKIYSYLSRLVITAIFVAATVVSGAAHRMPHAPLDGNLANYLQTGFSVDDFCGDIPGTDSGSGFCEFCHLVATSMLPDAADHCRVKLVQSGQVWETTPRKNIPKCYDNCRAARAPPVA